MSTQQPRIEYCLDLRELITLADFAQDQASAINAFLDTPGLESCRRLYAGSSFCPQALEHSLALIDAATAVCRERDIRMTLALPIPAQRFLEHQDQLLTALLQQHGDIIDELVVNDLGSLVHLSECIHNAYEGEPLFGMGLVVGRLLCKDARDPRSAAISWSSRVPAYLEPDANGENSLQQLIATCSFWSDERECYENALCGVELDPICEQLELSSLPDGLLPVLCGPLCYMSTGQICEYASIGLPAERAFWPNGACGAQCAKTCLHYRGASNVEFFKIGRSVFFEAPWQTRLASVSVYRQLVSPLKEVRG